MRKKRTLIDRVADLAERVRTSSELATVMSEESREDLMAELEALADELPGAATGSIWRRRIFLREVAALRRRILAG